jgi:hypothetical protein
MRIKTLRTAQTIKVDKEDNIFYGADYEIDALYNEEINATIVRIINTRKNVTAWTTFANVAYFELADEAVVKKPAARK